MRILLSNDDAIPAATSISGSALHDLTYSPSLGRRSGLYA
jgi:hypothetical protein